MRKPWAERRDRWILGATVALFFLVLGYLTFQGERADRFGFLAGIAWRLLQGILIVVLVYALLALGLNVQFGYTGLVNFGHVAFMGIGAYTAAILATHLGGPDLVPGWIRWALGPPFAEASLPWAIWYVVLIVVIATVVAVAFGLLLGIPTLRLREDYLAIVTIGAAETMRLVWMNEQDLTNGAQGIFTSLPGANWVLDETTGWSAWFAYFETVYGIRIDAYYTWLLIWLSLVVVGAYYLVETLARSPWGRVVKAIREDEDVASALGKDVFVYKLQALVLGAVLASIAGVFYAWFQRFLTPDSFLPLITFYVFIVMVLGGVGNHKGMIVGAFVFWGIFEVARNLPGADEVESFLGFSLFEGAGQIVIIGLLLVVLMMVRPEGIAGKREEMLFGK